ncbi:hypothetical protein [Bacillus pseudomycoides]|uniref:hypothetical protein n=1 Tax=Bacillus pseudomycoides TaxID=64104 RepID=UPI000BF00F0E|nr:hypothetical protein [Bacillus pseudomycoides]PEM69360.1 hypothetical protein CN619_21745 [Bacillus pseudomycoides]PGA62168.1 hypothetical protein COL84_13410 [Bacillus pseudomycoides]
MAKLSPPLGIKGYVVRVTKKKMKELVEGQTPHFITGYSLLLFDVKKGVYNCHMDEHYDNLTYLEVWEQLKKNNMYKYVRLCYQEI